MKLESARELKKSLVASIVAPWVEEGAAVTIRSYGVSAKPVSAAANPRTVALGLSRRDKNDFVLAVRVQHRALQKSKELEIICSKAREEVDVRYIGPLRKQDTPWHQKRNRPLALGCSVGHYKITAGTLGCFVRSRSEEDQSVLMLSNNHVLANENRAKPGDIILQPAVSDRGQNPDDAVGELHKFVRLRKTRVNLVDAAVATIYDGVQHDHTTLRGLDSLLGTGEPFVEEGTLVYKIGRTTGLTRGRVTAFELDNVVVGYDTGDLRFDNQIEIEGADDEPFSQGGDSGSLVVNSDYKATGLLFAGGDIGGSNGFGLTYISPLQAVLDALEIDLLY